MWGLVPVCFSGNPENGNQAPRKKMAGNTVIRINIKDDAQASMKGRRFSEIPRNAKTVSWILALPHVSGQMADIVKFLTARDSSREARPTEKARAVYMLCDDLVARTVVDAATLSERVRAKGKSDALAGGLRCDQGHTMKFVDCHMSRGSAVGAYFAHVTKNDTRGGGGGGGAGSGGCSDVHLMAQLLIKKHLSRILATRFKSCGECVEFAFRAAPGMRAEIEVPERLEGGKIRSDVVVYKNDERHVSFEVKHTHATRAASRAGLQYLEVNAGHVVSQFENCQSTGAVRLKCENATTPCTSGCAERRTTAAEARPQLPYYGARCWACHGSGSYSEDRPCRVCEGLGALFRNL
jgi:hypothetical protein